MAKLPPIPKGVEITDQITKHLDRRFLSAADFMGMGVVELTIDRLEKLASITYGNGKTEKNVILAYFKGTEKPLSLCLTNALDILEVLGTGSGWAGKKIRVEVKIVDAFGKKVPAVRIKK